MTQKELAYFEDAVGHEDIIIKSLQETLENLQDEDLSSLVETDIEKHNSLKQELLRTMEEQVNE